MSGDRIVVAKTAILEDLKQRFKSGDKTVQPAKQEDLCRWYRPQANYYSGAGSITCPVCKTGTLRYARNSYNGHVRAACSTDNCVRWME